MYMSEPDGVCQATHADLVACSKRRLVPTRLATFCWCLARLGPRATGRLVKSKLGRLRAGGVRKAGVRQHGPAHGRDEALDLRAGEVVVVKTEAEIRQTLDEQGRHHGLLWMPSMARFCGKEYTVRKRVDHIMLESTGQLRKIRNTVLLEGVMCEDLYGCDRSCFHYWREAWLRRASGGRHDAR